MECGHVCPAKCHEGAFPAFMAWKHMNLGQGHTHCVTSLCRELVWASPPCFYKNPFVLERMAANWTVPGGHMQMRNTSGARTRKPEIAVSSAMSRPCHVGPISCGQPCGSGLRNFGRAMFSACAPQGRLLPCGHSCPSQCHAGAGPSGATLPMCLRRARA